MKEESNETHVKCRCNHLTNFAILMDIHGVDESVTNRNMIFFEIVTLFSSFCFQLSEIDKFALMIITRCGCGISIFFLFITIMIFLKFR